MRISDEMYRAWAISYWDEDLPCSKQEEVRAKEAIAAALAAGGFKEEITTLDNFGSSHQVRIVGLWEQKT